METPKGLEVATALVVKELPRNTEQENGLTNNTIVLLLDMPIEVHQGIDVCPWYSGCLINDPGSFRFCFGDEGVFLPTILLECIS